MLYRLLLQEKQLPLKGQGRKRYVMNFMAWLCCDVGSTAYDAISTFRIDYLVDVLQNLEVVLSTLTNETSES